MCRTASSLTPALVTQKTSTEQSALRVTFEVTERCNMSCGHCYICSPNVKSSPSTAEINTQQICNILDSAIKVGCSRVRFTGGEPLIRDDFQQFYLHAFTQGLEITVNTNGTLISDKIADFLRNHPATAITISLYGWDESSYNATVNRQGAYREFSAGIARLRERQIAFQMMYPPIARLVRNRKLLGNFAQDLGASLPLPYTWDLTLHAYRDQSACKRIQRLRLSPEDAAREKLKEPSAAIYELKALRGLKHRTYGLRAFQCRDRYNHLVISAKGQLLICPCLRHPETCYDLLRGDLSDALERHIPRLRKRRITNEEYLNRCAHCVLRTACPQCPANSWMETGELDMPSEYYCRFMHAEAALLGILPHGVNGWEIHDHCDSATSQ